MLAESQLFGEHLVSFAASQESLYLDYKIGGDIGGDIGEI